MLQYLDFYKNDPRGRTIVAILVSQERPVRADASKRSAQARSARRPDVGGPWWRAGLTSDGLLTRRCRGGYGSSCRRRRDCTGLVVDRWVDERLDPVRSTHAAAMYLQDLNRRFGTWELALGSYNMGFGGMLSSIRK